MKKIKKFLNIFLYIAAIGISVFLLFFIISCTWIGFEVRNQCQQAQRTYKGDCIDVLIAVLNDESRGYRERNDAIWSLGQLGDKRAYPVLKNYYTGIIPQREPLDKTISQYELKKAVNLTSGGLNISAIIWRSGLFSAK